MNAKTDAIDLLTRDHEDVKKAFKEFKALGDRAFQKKRELADKICKDLLVHTQIEEEILYPLFTENLAEGSKSLANEAIVEHASAKQLISQIQQASSDSDLFDARVKVLSEYIDHHVKEEEEEMFPKLRQADVDLGEIGEKMQVRKKQLS